MRIGYARTSTVDQVAGYDAQIRDLRAERCEKVFSEQVSSIGQRDQLEAVLEFAREGDTIIVTKLDRLARSTRDLMDIVDRLKNNGVELIVLNPRLDTSGHMGEFMLTIFGAVAQLERSMMLERQREGIAKAKAAGKYKGRAPTARRKSSQVHDLAAQGMRKVDIARTLNIGQASVYRILADAKPTPEQAILNS